MPAMQAVERIEVVRGAASLQYGTQFGGMLNFKLKEAPDKPFELNLEQSVGSFGLLNSFMSVGGRGKKLDYYGYYQYRTGDGWRDNSGFDAHQAFTSIGYQVNDKLKIKFEYSFLEYEAQQPGGLADSDFEEGNLEESRRARNWFKVNWNLFASIVDYKFSSKTSLNIRSFGLYSNRGALGNLERITANDDPGENRTLIQDDFTNFGSEARLLHRYQLRNKNAALLIGARYYNGLTERKQGDASSTDAPEFRLLNPNNPEVFDYDFPSRNYAFFVENLIDVTPKLSLTSGFRLEHIRTDSEGVWKRNFVDFAGNLVATTVNNEANSVVRSFPLFGLGLSYYINDDLNFYSNFSQNFRSITFSDLRVENPNFQLDSLIMDENGYNMDIGLRGELNDWLNIDVSIFLMRYNDRIGQFEPSGSTTLLRSNIGDSRHFGIESYAEIDVFQLLKKEVSESRLSVFLNLALTDAEYIQSDKPGVEGRRVEYVPGVMLRSGINYKWKGLKATYQYSYLGDQFSDATNSDFSPNPIIGLIPSYQVMDFSVEYQVSRYKFSSGVNNLTNEKYFTRRAESYPGPGIIPATIRSFYLSLGVKI